MMLRVNLNLRCASILIFSYLKIYLRLTSPYHKIDLLSCRFSWRVYAFFRPNPSSLCTCIDDRRTRAVSSQQEKIIFLGKLDWLVGLVWKTVYRNGLWWDENRGNWVGWFVPCKKSTMWITSHVINVVKRVPDL